MQSITSTRRKVRQYKPGSTLMDTRGAEFPKKLYIGLYGMTNSGKSSLINSVRYAVDGSLDEEEWVQITGHQVMGGHTMFRTPVDITESFVIVDNRGMKDPSKADLHEEVKAQIMGKRTFNFKVNWRGSTVAPYGHGTRIHTVVLVFSASQEIGPEVHELSKLIPDLYQLQGRYPVAVITHEDSNPDGVRRLKTHLALYGISDIYTVANVRKNKLEMNEDYQQVLLKFVYRCMVNGDQNIIFHHDQGMQKKAEEDYQRRLADERSEAVAKYKEEKKCILL